MKNPYDIIDYPVSTEKAVRQMEMENCLIFIVKEKATKPQIKGAIEKAFNDHSIPYQTIGEKPLFKEKPVKAILTLLKLSYNPSLRLLKNTAFAFV